MARAFLTRSPADEHDAVVEAVAGRENELASYDSNVLGYQQQLATLNAALPAAWPAELTKFKGKASEQLAAIGGTDAELLLASQLNHRDRVKFLLFTEQAERAKTELAYQQCLSQLPPNPVDKKAALERYVAKVAAQKAKNL